MSKGIASALTSGAIDLGGTVSNMKYDCSKVIEKQEDYVAEEKKQEVKAKTTVEQTLIGEPKLNNVKIQQCWNGEYTVDLTTCATDPGPAGKSL